MYYPEFYILTDKFSEGELIHSTTDQPYTGFYWETAKGRYFTGRYPNESLNQVELFNDRSGYDTHNKDYQDLTPQYYNFSSKNLTYLKLKNIPNPNAPGLPSYCPTIPTEQDYEDEEFIRFFCRRKNNYSYLEINEKTFNKLQKKDTNIDYAKFIPFTLPWVIKGDQNQVALENKNTVEHRESRLGHKNLGVYLKNNYLQFYK